MRPAALALLLVFASACRDATAPPKPAAIAPTVSTAIDGTAGLLLAAPPTFVVNDASGNPIGGVKVTIVVTGGGGTLLNPPTKTASNGATPVGTWTLGKTAGPNTVTVTVDGLPVATIAAEGSWRRGRAN